MRLRELHLHRYGRFEDAVLDFGDIGPSGADVTVVLGANEAGKSTAFAAWLDFLFGIKPGKHSYAYRFERKDLLVGAVIETADGRMAMRRTSSREDNLVDPDGRAVPEGRLANLLHGLDKEGYRTRFSLDDAILRQGGADIALAKGDLGRLLHAGSTGLNGVSSALDAMEGQAEAFHKKRGRATRLAEASKELSALDARLRETTLSPSRRAELAGAVERAEDAYRLAVRQEEDARRAERVHAAAAARAEHAARIADLDRALADLPGGPDLPDEAFERIAAAETRITRSATDEAEADEALAEATAFLDTNPHDPSSDALAAELKRIDALRFGDVALTSRVDTARGDLANRRREHDEGAAELRRLAGKVAGSDAEPAALVLPPDRLDDLDEAVAALEGAESRAGEAQNALEEAVADLALSPEPMPVREIVGLEDALGAFDAADRPAPYEDAVRQAGAALETARLALPADWATYVEAGLPSAELVDQRAGAFAQADEAARAAEARLADAMAAHGDAVARRGVVAQRPETVPAGMVTQAQAAREAAWAAHRATLAKETADAFEDAMRAHDRLSADHAAGAQTRVRLLQCEEAAAAIGADMKRLTDAREAALGVRGDAVRGLAQLAAQLGLPGDARGPAIHARRAALEGASTARRALDAARGALQPIEAQWRTARHTLLKTAVAAGMTAQAAEDIGAVRAFIAAATKAREAHATWSERRRAVDARTRAVGRRKQEREEAARRVEGAIDGLPLSGAIDGPSMRAAHRVLQALATSHGQQIVLERRVRLMEEAIAQFDDAGQRLAVHLGEDGSAETLLTAARARVRDAALASERRTGAEARAQEARKRHAGALADRAVAEAEIARLLAGQGGEALDAPHRLFALRKRETLRRERSSLVAAHDREARDCDPDALAGEEALPPDPARAAALSDLVREAGTAREEAIIARTHALAALHAADNADGSGRAHQAKATLLAELREEARAHAVRRLSLLAARAALRRLASEQRGTMLREAEAAFVAMTGGEWKRLDTWTPGTGEQLVGYRDDDPVAVEAMSTGTRGQLYLALRLAGHLAFCRDAGSLPFVADDILETFDDERAAATLKLMDELGRRGQAILFTHHAHLAAMASRQIPGARVIDMPT